MKPDMIEYVSVNASASQVLDPNASVSIDATAFSKEDGGIRIAGFVGGDKRGYRYEINVSGSDMMKILEALVTKYVSAKLAAD